MTFSVILGPSWTSVVHLGAICAASGVGGFFFFSICRKEEKVLGWLRKPGRLPLCGLVALGVPVLLYKGKLFSVVEPKGDDLGTGMEQTC